MPRLLQTIFLVLVGGVLWIPAWGLLQETEGAETCEKRTLAKFPEETEPIAFGKAFEAYFKDHFLGRAPITQAASLIRAQLFQSSPRPDKVVIGKDSWLFYMSRSDKVFDSFTHQNLLSEKELADLFARWNRRQRILKDRGVSYYQAVWPNKATIYPEFLPARMASAPQGEISKIDQVLAYGQEEHPNLPILDVRASLMEEKAKALYRRLDTHWNDLGAYYAYRELMAFLGEEAYPMEAFTQEERETSEGDLMNMLGLCGLQTFSETIPIFQYPNWTQITKESTERSNLFVMRNPLAPKQQRLLVFRDSFTSALVPFISRHYAEVYFMWSDFREEVVWEVEPDVVVEAKVERYF